MSSRPHIIRATWVHVLVPLTALTLYLVSFSFFFSWLFPEHGRSVNAAFVDQASRCSLILVAIAHLLFFALFRTTGGTKLTLDGAAEKLTGSDLILLLLPLTPVVQYIVSNQDILSPIGSLYVLAVFVLFCVLLVLVVPALTGHIGSAYTMMLLGAAFAFMITNMASLSTAYRWFKEGNLGTQFTIFFAIVVAGRLLYHNRVTRKLLYVFIVGFFVSGIGLQFIPEDRGRMPPDLVDGKNRLVELIGHRSPSSTPSIYLLVYDGYVVNETMLGYGIDNSAQEEYLAALGFTLYPHTYSIGAASLSTMSGVLNACTEYYGNARRGASGDGIVQNLLKGFGYETHGIFQSDYFFRGVGSSYDYAFPEPRVSSAHDLLVTAIFMGEFRFDVDVEFDSPSRPAFVEHKTGAFASLSRGPRFVYMHDYLPGHSQNSGTCLPNESALFLERLMQANQQMKQDVETLMENDPGAIIIVAGDHGPYLTKNCIATGRDYDISEICRLDIQDRFGTFLAIRWPTEGSSEYDDITVLQDLLPVIFAYLFEDPGLLEAKVEPDTLDAHRISGAQVMNGIIYGGINDGEPLFLSDRSPAGGGR